MPMGKTDR